MKIMLMGLEHTNPWSFNDPWGRLGLGFPLQDGQFYLENEEIWTEDMEVTDAEFFMDLETVALHEICHLIGLDHSKLSCSMIYSLITFRKINHHLTSDDIQG